MIQTVFAEADWYRARDEPEVRREGVLAPHRHPTGPRTRGGCDFVLRGLDGDELVYSAGVERLLSRVAGRRVTVVGKLVVVDGRSELWIGRLSTTREPTLAGRMGGMAHESDEVDRIVEAWTLQRPDLDFSPLEVLSRVDRLSRHLDRARKDAFRRSDLEPWEWDVLSALRRAGHPYQLSPKQLLQQTLVSSGTMTNRIDRLVGRRLVRREADPDDGRSILVILTDDGRLRVDAAITRLVDAEAELLDALSRGDRERLAALLRKLSLGFDA